METHQDPDHAPSRRPQHGAAEGLRAAGARAAGVRRPGQAPPACTERVRPALVFEQPAVPRRKRCNQRGASAMVVIRSRYRRLLCAAQQAYEINVRRARAGLARRSRRRRRRAWSAGCGAPAAEVAGDDRSTRCWSARRPPRSSSPIRGTEPFDSPDHQRMVLDWLDDLLRRPLVAAPNVPRLGPRGLQPRLSTSFGPGCWRRCRALPTKTKPLYVTGHSKGGALANIAAVKLRRRRPDAVRLHLRGRARRRSGLRRRLRRSWCKRRPGTNTRTTSSRMLPPRPRLLTLLQRSSLPDLTLVIAATTGSSRPTSPSATCASSTGRTRSCPTAWRSRRSRAAHL